MCGCLFIYFCRCITGHLCDSTAFLYLVVVAAVVIISLSINSVAMVSGVGHGMGVVIVKDEGAVFWVNFGHPIVSNGDSDALFPKYFGEDLFYLVVLAAVVIISLSTRNTFYMERGICPIAPLVLRLTLYSLTGSQV